MLIRDLFMEATIPLRGGGSVNVSRNVAVGNLLIMLDNISDKALRGLITGDEVVWWDAYRATHSQVASVYAPDLLDMDRLIDYKKARLAIKNTDGEIRLYAGQDAASLSAIPPLTRLMARDLPLTVTMKDFAF